MDTAPVISIHPVVKQTQDVVQISAGLSDVNMLESYQWIHDEGNQTFQESMILRDQDIRVGWVKWGNQRLETLPGAYVEAIIEPRENNPMLEEDTVRETILAIIRWPEVEILLRKWYTGVAAVCQNSGGGGGLEKFVWYKNFLKEDIIGTECAYFIASSLQILGLGEVKLVRRIKPLKWFRTLREPGLQQLWNGFTTGLQGVHAEQEAINVALKFLGLRVAVPPHNRTELRSNHEGWGCDLDSVYIFVCVGGIHAYVFSNATLRTPN
ncbi:hypothetical protein P691DRAFT_764245 [Macrolepiota fuliginosa MF-IS2]|uniref:Uncharacterized protein n=1 Tax=Macrolepiota fuliginosa MF-IS2 TaxID=1400762 RepID=A0A9P5X5Z8_9AGAR|nr:hypothetical protein P691DRAFT_764245 [Macrolepiota fuliginosa MF-IS2]